MKGSPDCDVSSRFITILVTQFGVISFVAFAHGLYTFSSSEALPWHVYWGVWIVEIIVLLLTVAVGLCVASPFIRKFFRGGSQPELPNAQVQLVLRIFYLADLVALAVILYLTGGPHKGPYGPLLIALPTAVLFLDEGFKYVLTLAAICLIVFFYSLFFSLDFVSPIIWKGPVYAFTVTKLLSFLVVFGDALAAEKWRGIA